MPTMKHEILIEMVRRRPALVTDLLSRSLNVINPAFHEARLLPGDFTMVAPAEYRADQVTDEIPVVEDPGRAREGPDLAVLSALAV